MASGSASSPQGLQAGFQLVEPTPRREQRIDLMPVHSSPDPETLQREIQALDGGCRQHGVNPNDTCNLRQNRLMPEQLAFRLEQNREFLEIAPRSKNYINLFAARDLRIISPTLYPYVFIDQRITGLQRLHEHVRYWKSAQWLNSKLN